jgi:hypothetical protein
MPPARSAAIGRVRTAIVASLDLPARAGAAEADLTAVRTTAYGDDDEYPTGCYGGRHGITGRRFANQEHRYVHRKWRQK